MKQPILIYLLFTLFVGLKLTDQIAWSWWWVFAPLWIYALASLMAGFIAGYRAVRKAHLRQKEMLDKALGRPFPQSKH